MWPRSLATTWSRREHRDLSIVPGRRGGFFRHAPGYQPAFDCLKRDETRTAPQHLGDLWGSERQCPANDRRCLWSGRADCQFGHGVFVDQVVWRGVPRLDRDQPDAGAGDGAGGRCGLWRGRAALSDGFYHLDDQPLCRHFLCRAIPPIYHARGSDPAAALDPWDHLSGGGRAYLAGLGLGRRPGHGTSGPLVHDHDQPGLRRADDRRGGAFGPQGHRAAALTLTIEAAA
mmetsp:Transcript_18554/g.30613  ORF Transcript_18554/g.30613 Transcript_18554/m.30613 type:complete len:230 (-) Transcript_18554:4652-5341(-)